MDNPHFNHFIREIFDNIKHVNEELEKVKNFIGYNDRMQSPTRQKINQVRMYAHQPRPGPQFDPNPQFDPKNSDSLARELTYGGTRRKRSKKSKTRKVKK